MQLSLFKSTLPQTPILQALKKGIPVLSGGYEATLIAYDPNLPAPIMCAIKKPGKASIIKDSSDPYTLEAFTIQGKSLYPGVGDLKVKGYL